MCMCMCKNMHVHVWSGFDVDMPSVRWNTFVKLSVFNI